MPKSEQKRNFVMTTMMIVLLAPVVFTFNPANSAYAQTPGYSGMYDALDPIELKCDNSGDNVYVSAIDVEKTSGNDILIRTITNLLRPYY